MPIATPKQYAAMLDAAQKGDYAYAAINVTSIITINGALKAFADKKCDGIIQVSTGGGEFASGTSVKDAAYGRSSWPRPHIAWPRSTTSSLLCTPTTVSRRKSIRSSSR